MQHKIGRIVSAQICLGGKYRSELGLQITFAAEQHNGQPDSSWSASEFESVPYVYEAGGREVGAHLVGYLGNLLTQADVTGVHELAGKPVICTFQPSGDLYSWSLVKTMDS